MLYITLHNNHLYSTYSDKPIQYDPSLGASGIAIDIIYQRVIRQYSSSFQLSRQFFYETATLGNIRIEDNSRSSLVRWIQKVRFVNEQGVAEIRGTVDRRWHLDIEVPVRLGCFTVSALWTNIRTYGLGNGGERSPSHYANLVRALMT